MGDRLCPSARGGLVACWQEEESGLGPALPGWAPVQYIALRKRKLSQGCTGPCQTRRRGMGEWGWGQNLNVVPLHRRQ